MSTKSAASDSFSSHDLLTQKIDIASTATADLHVSDKHAVEGLAAL
jgi:hypothetical protein